MSGNTLGKLFCITTFGESHGPAYGCIVDGCPPGLELTDTDIQIELDKRRPGQSKYTSQRLEKDQVQILSGVYLGKTTGTPIGLLIPNEDSKSRDYDHLESLFRPGHADYTYYKKYRIRDHRGGGRASARETMMRVAAGAIAKKYLQGMGIKIQGYLAQMGPIALLPIQLNAVYDNHFFSPEPEKIPDLESLIDDVRKKGDSIGARINIIAEGVPTGLGEPVFDRLDADIGKALFSINAVKGVELGKGFGSVTQFGSEHRDAITPTGFASNHAGGILGGISNGDTITASIALKPTSSINHPIETIDKDNNPVLLEVKGRHDPCVGLRAVPVAEAMMAIVLMDHLLRDRGQNAN